MEHARRSYKDSSGAYCANERAKNSGRTDHNQAAVYTERRTGKSGNTNNNQAALQAQMNNKSYTRHDWVTALRNVLVGVGHMLQEPVTGAMLGEGISKIVSTGDFDNADFAPGYQVLNP